MTKQITPATKTAPPPIENAGDASAAFDYAGLGDNLATELREIATTIRRRTKDRAIDTGRELLAIKKDNKIEHGQFTTWVEGACELTMRTAQNMMNAARWVDSKSENVSLLPMTIIYALAADDVPEEVEAEVIAEFQAGGRPTVDNVKERIAAARKEVAEVLAIADATVKDLHAATANKTIRRRALDRILAAFFQAEREPAALEAFIHSVTTVEAAAAE
jgi:hypothetical protein